MPFTVSPRDSDYLLKLVTSLDPVLKQFADGLPEDALMADLRSAEPGIGLDWSPLAKGGPSSPLKKSS